MPTNVAWVLASVAVISISVGAMLGGSFSPTQQAITDLLEAEEMLCAGLFEEAERRVRRALKKQPRLAAAHHLLGRIRLEQGRLVEAEAAFATAASVLRDIDSGPGRRPPLRSAMLVATLDRARALHIVRTPDAGTGEPPAATTEGDSRQG